MPTFEYLQLSLSVPTIGALAEDGERHEPEVDRQAYLTEVFSLRRDFFYSGRQYTYVPAPPDVQGPDVYAGYIGKPVEELVNAGPDELFALTKSKHYKASFVVVDVQAERQVVAFERRQDVGSAHRILEALFESVVRERKGFSWHTDIEYKSSEKDFWHAAEEYRGRITELTFEFYPPNGLLGFDKFKEFDRIAKHQANGQSSEYSIKNPDGAVRPEGEFVESAAEYAAEGPGKITMKEGRKTLFSSRQAKRTKDAPEGLMPRQSEPAKILGLITFLFGKEKDDG